jgi:C_GCAxxG_C_C family probable redox protein
MDPHTTDEEKEIILQRAYESGKQHELDSGGCAQCCLSGVFEALGIEDEGVFRAATGFADGVGLSGDGHCGALSGGVLSIGYLFGRKKSQFGDMKKQLKALILSRKLHHEFTETFGTCRCRDLQTKQAGRFFDLFDPREMEAALAAGLPEKCSNVVGEAARMTTRIILEETERAARNTG